MADAQIVTELTLIDRQTAGVQKAEAEMKKLGATTQATMAGLKKDTANVDQSFKQVQTSIAGAGTAARATTISMAAIGAAIGVTSLIAVGASLVIAKLGESITDLQNSFLDVPRLANDTAGALRFVVAESDRTGLSLQFIGRNYERLSQQARQYGISQETVTRSITAYNNAISARKEDTISDGFRRAKEQAQLLANSIDKALGLTRIWNTVLDGVANTFRWLRSLIPVDTVTSLQIQLSRVDEAIGKIEARMSPWQRDSIFRTNELNRLYTEQKRLLGEIQTFTPEPVATPPPIDPTTLMSALGSLQASLRTQEEAELFSHQRRLEQLAEFQTARLLTETEANNLLSREFFRHSVEMQQIAQQSAQMHFQAISGAMQEAQSLLGVFAGKNKAAAIAAIVVNKGLALAQASMNTAVAATRALAELGPIAGPPMAAAIKTWGAVQMGLIAATGLGQIASLGGSAPSAGGGGSSGSSGTVTGTETTNMAPPTRAIHITLEPHKLYSAEQMTELINALNNETQNGATLIATSVMGS